MPVSPTCLCLSCPDHGESPTTAHHGPALPGVPQFHQRRAVGAAGTVTAATG